jgi:hypothetical protein
LFDHRYYTVQFLGFADRFRPGARGFAADVENFRALRDQFQRVCDGFGRIKKFSAVGKRIGRDVDNTHDESRPWKNEFKPARAENDFAGSKHELIVNGFGGFCKATLRRFWFAGGPPALVFRLQPAPWKQAEA